MDGEPGGVVNSQTLFTHVAPLGSSCRVTHQLRMFFRARERYPFDWWISPLDGIALYLADLDTNRLFETLEEVGEDGWIETIRSHAYGLDLFHEFPRVSADRPMRVVSPDWRDHIVSARLKHETRLRRLLALNRPGNRILFVRHKAGPGVESHEIDAWIDRLWSSLETHWPDAEKALLLINLDGASPHPSPPRRTTLRMTVDERPPASGEAWRGDDATWAAAFRSLGFCGAPLTGEARIPSPDEEV